MPACGVAGSRAEAVASFLFSFLFPLCLAPGGLCAAGEMVQASSRGEAKDSALLSSRDAGLLEPPERPQGSPASSSVWREDPGLLSRPCRKRRPSAREDGGVSGVSSSCGARGGFLPRHDEDLREPLVRRQGSQVSMRVARGSASWLSSHGRGLGPRDALKKDSRGLCRGAAGNPRVPRLLPGTLGNFPGCL